MFRIAGTMATVAAAVAARGCQQKDVGAFGRVFRERATYPQRFVIGVCQHGHQSRSLHGFFDLFRFSFSALLGSRDPALLCDRLRLPLLIERPESLAEIPGQLHLLKLESRVAKFLVFSQHLCQSLKLDPGGVSTDYLPGVISAPLKK